jgi:photosystem II stability/assembly factor-like uncharacterized protein
MKKIILLQFIASILLFSLDSFAQWTQSGLEGGIVNSISVRNNGVLYIATYRGVYFSTNFGDNWERGNTNLDAYTNTTSIAFGTSNIYAIANSTDGQTLLFKSQDNGYNFSTVSCSGFNANLILASNDIIYAGNKTGNSYYYGSVSYSSNSGSNWIQTNLSKTLNIYDLSLINNTLYASGDSGVYSTTNTGTAWIKLNNGLPENIIVYSFRVNGNDFIIGSDKGIFRSTNSGSYWMNITNGLPTFIAYYGIEVKDNIIFVSNYSRGIYKSSNNGLNWVRCENGLNDLLINKFLVSGNYIYAVSLGGGIYTSYDYGETWYSKNAGFRGHCVYSMLSIGNMLFAGTHGGGIYYSNDGQTWLNVSSGLTNTIVYSMLNINYDLYAGTYGGIFKSTNFGGNWFAVNTGLVDSITFTMTNTNSSLFAGTQGGGLYKSDDWGTNWYKANNGITSDTIKALANLNGVLFAGTYSKGIFRSTNSGQNWLACNTGFQNLPNALTFCVKGNTFYTCNYGTGGFYSSIDNGVSWNSILSTAYGGNNVLSSLVYNNAVIVGVYNISGGMILVTTNNGTNWANVSSPGTGNPAWVSTDLRSLSNYNGNLLVGTFGKSIYSRPFSQFIGIRQISSVVPDKFELFQNYPNPFNPSTTIKFSIPARGYGHSLVVQLKIYNILGKEIATLVNEKLSPGEYEIPFSINQSSSGVYFYRLHTDYFTGTKRMLFIK